MKKIYIVMAALAFVMCTKVEPIKSQTEYTELDQPDKVEIKVMSSNIRSGSTDAGIQLWSYRRFAYMNMLSEAQPDIIGLQECKDNQVETLLLADEYAFWRVPEYDLSDPSVLNTHLPPNVIMYRKSKFELLDKGIFYYNENDPSKPCHYPCGATGWQVRGCVWVKLAVKSNGKTIYFFDTHYTHDPTEIQYADGRVEPIVDADGNKVYNIEPRRKASAMAVEQMEKIAVDKDAAVFFVGDLNCSLADGSTRNGPRSLEPLMTYMWSAREEAHSYDGGISFNGFTEYKNGKIGNIDHIFYRGAEALDFVTFNSPDYGVTYISDHYPVMCSFAL